MNKLVNTLLDALFPLIYKCVPKHKVLFDLNNANTEWIQLSNN